MILDAGTDSRVLFFTFLVAMLVGVLLGLAPALRASKADLLSAMKDNASAVSDPRNKHRLGESLIVAQVAASVVLMIGAGLFVRTLTNFERSEEHTSELQSRLHLVCRLLLEKKKI